jgi:hypothetical protein
VFDPNVSGTVNMRAATLHPLLAFPQNELLEPRNADLSLLFQICNQVCRDLAATCAAREWDATPGGKHIRLWQLLKIPEDVLHAVLPFG